MVRLSSQTLVKLVEQLLQRHLLFRNSLQERLSAEHWKSLVGDVLVQLIGQNDVSPDCPRVRACARARDTEHTSVCRASSLTRTLDTRPRWRPSSLWR